MNNDLISREELKAHARKVICGDNPTNTLLIRMFDEIIDNAPTVEAEKTKESEIIKAYTKGFDTGVETVKNARPQGEYVDISKLRLMTVEECAGHTIDYALGWKACIEWIKKGGAE